MNHFHTKYRYFTPKHYDVKRNLIFINIASYRDPLCYKTINSIYENAKWPDNIRIGLCIQDIFHKCETNEYSRYIKTIKLNYTSAKGPTWARYLCNTLWDGEEYFLQIDSHTSFVKNWDSDIINMLSYLPKKSIITYYPPNIGSPGNIKNITVHTISAHINERNHIISKSKRVPSTDKPHAAYFISCGFLFCKSQFIIDVPWDPYLPYLFQGEESLLTMRAFTNGWVLFHPCHAVCYHYYYRKNEPRFWTDLYKYYTLYNPLSNKRAKYFLKLENKDTKYPNIYLYEEVFGPGYTKSINEWFSFFQPFLTTF